MKILHLEDNPRDAELVAELLTRESPDLEIILARDRKAYVAALNQGGFEVILCDFNVPGFDGREALQLALELQPDVPLIFISGTVGEETAIESVRRGAADYLLKDRIQRLPLAIQRARKDREARRHRHEAEELIREQAELLDKTRDGIVVTDLAYRILYWNHGAELIFGWTPDEAEGRNALELFGRGLEASIATMERFLAANEEWRGEIPVIAKSGRSVLIELRITVIRDAAGQPKSCLSIIDDITERRKLEEQFLRAQRLESLGMLATGIAHDLNNALAPMLMAGEILRQRMSAPEERRLLELLGRSGQRAAGVVKQIVAFASGGTQEKVLIQTKHLLRDILQLMEETFPRSLQLEHKIPRDLWTVEGNPSQLHQMLLNLCINARDAMPEGGTLRLEAANRVLAEAEADLIPDAAPGRFVVVEVTDTGPGIPPFVLGHIWQPFFTAKEEIRGSGLGLSTVRGIAVNHAGFVNVESELGHGAKFQVFLPASGVSDAVPDAPGSAAVVPGNGELVLVVDDEEGIRESIGMILRQDGYRPLVTADGIQALSQYAGRIREISLVITDLEMPGLGGVAFSQAIHLLNPAAKILFISGAAQPGITAIEGMAKSVGFLAKPFPAQVLRLKLQELLESRNE
jgi:two-component system, cell cycle sensor histidine kinase and response regulator CckA